jgi:hypothetical protein
MQYVGEYDVGGNGGLTRLTLHVDGTFDGVGARGTIAGTFAASGAGDAAHVPATLFTDGAGLSVASFHGVPPSAGGPPRFQVDISGPLGEVTLVAPWVAGTEAGCDATGGAWADDAPDPATGLYCGCPAVDLYLPSRGGCVASTASGDPPRPAPSKSMRSASGHYTGEGRITDLQLDADGTYRATVDERPDAGTWWDASAPDAFALTSAAQSFWASVAGDALTMDLGNRAETLHRDR